MKRARYGVLYLEESKKRYPNKREQKQQTMGGKEYGEKESEEEAVKERQNGGLEQV
jgi:hypothetical protein